MYTKFGFTYLSFEGKIQKAKFIRLIQNDVRLKATVTATKNKVSQEKYIIFGNNI